MLSELFFLHLSFVLEWNGSNGSNPYMLFRSNTEDQEFLNEEDVTVAEWIWLGHVSSLNQSL